VTTDSSAKVLKRSQDTTPHNCFSNVTHKTPNPSKNLEQTPKIQHSKPKQQTQNSPTDKTYKLVTATKGLNNGYTSRKTASIYRKKNQLTKSKMTTA